MKVRHLKRRIRLFTFWIYADIRRPGMDWRRECRPLHRMSRPRHINLLELFADRQPSVAVTHWPLRLTNKPSLTMDGECSSAL